ncbi:MAG: hypothetical protein JSV90_05030 [Methanobacteriota archaeon]|nr:MAG: hypothetical protein JSV90_05030 [Euryarchaeota archaeon]
MPTPAESLTKDSSDEEIREAVGKAIEMLVGEGMAQDQAVAVAMEQARRATGKDLQPAGGRSRVAH